MQRKSSVIEETHKIILLGDSCVGKTSLMNRWLNDSFEKETRTTIGASNFFKTVQTNDGDSIKIALWDTAGQEQYRAIAPLYIRGAKVEIVVVSAADIQTFDSISFWNELISSNQEKSAKLILAINKVDLVDSSNEDLSLLIEKCSPLFDQVFLVSAKSGENVDNLFNCAAILAKKVQPLNNVDCITNFNEPKTNSCC